MADNPEWPSYSIGLKDSIFALGVVSINFANFESAQIWVFAAVGAMPEDGARMVHARIGAKGCADLTKQIITKRTDWPSEPLALANHCAAASKILIDNWNLLMHSVITEGWQGKAALYRTGRKGERQMTSASLEQIQSVADRLVAYFDFGWKLADRIAVELLNVPQQSGSAAVQAWPEKPPLPIRLE
jgi:hypothetical protein